MLHGDGGAAGVFAHIVNRADVRTIERGRGLGLALESRQRLRVARHAEISARRIVQPRVFRPYTRPPFRHRQFLHHAAAANEILSERARPCAGSRSNAAEKHERRRDAGASLKPAFVQRVHAWAEIVDDVLDVLDAHESRTSMSRRIGRVGHQRGQANQRWPAEQIFTECARAASRSNASIALGPPPPAARDLVLGMRCQSGVGHFLHFRMRVQVPRHGNTVGIVLQHAHHRGRSHLRETRKQSIGASPAPADRWMK